jgi:hypothetical protein
MPGPRLCGVKSPRVEALRMRSKAVRLLLSLALVRSIGAKKAEASARRHRSEFKSWRTFLEGACRLGNSIMA